MSYNSSVYNEDYYKSHCGENYERGNGWEEIFARQAERIVKELNPKNSLDVGCAAGYLVEGLRDRGVDAKGIDVSEYAISKVRDDIKPFCKIQSATEPIQEKYDLITCIEVMEHLSPEDFTLAIDNMCQATDTIIFSSTPFDFNEESHFSVNTPSFWAEKFAYNGFYHDVEYDCSYIAVQTMLFRRGEKKLVDSVRMYENKLFDLWRENCNLRDSVNLANARINDLDRGNIQHAHEIASYDEKINHMQNEYEVKIADLQKQLEHQNEENEIRNAEAMKDFTDGFEKQRIEYEAACRERIRTEYVKRDILEHKFAVNAEYTAFLQGEIGKYKSVYDEHQMLLKEVSRYRQSRLMRKCYALSLRIENRRKKYGKYSSKKLLKKGLQFWAPVFNAETYCRYNQDIVQAIGTDEKKLLKHFIYYGMSEGRKASEMFDVYAYSEFNPDVAMICGEDLKDMFIHYIEHGIRENRRANW